MKYAPIIIPTLNRVEHLARLLESLKRNEQSCYTDVYIGLDYPPSDSYKDGYKKMCSYLSGNFACFRNFTVIKRSENYGYLRNVDDLVDYVLSKYDRFIYMDDDLELSSNFLEYMNTCLERYEKRDDIIAICGYSYPLKWNASPEATICEESFICPMWGTGFWKDKYNKISQYISKERGLTMNARSIIKNRGFRRMTDVCKSEFVDLCLSPDFNITLASRVTDIALRMYMAANDKYAIMPLISKVRNWGFDGTGQFCLAIAEKSRFSAKNYQYHLQTIDSQKGFLIKNDSMLYNLQNRDLMNDFDPVTIRQKLYMYIKLSCYYILRDNFYNMITTFAREMKTRFSIQMW